MHDAAEYRRSEMMDASLGGTPPAPATGLTLRGPADEILVADLAAAWPVPTGDPRAGYLPRLLDGTRLLDAWSMPRPGAGPGPAVALALAEDPGGRTHLLPVAHDQTGWRPAAPGDGVAEALVTMLEGSREGLAGRVVLRWLDRPSAIGSERGIGVDQTNASVVVGERVMVKWILAPDPRSTRGAARREHLSKVGFREVPRLHGVLDWERSDSPPLVLALIDEYLPDAMDGWQWCVDAVRDHVEGAHGRGGPGSPGQGPAAFAEGLGALVARLHAALAAPADGDPSAASDRTAERDVIAAWHKAARRTVEAAAAVEASDADVVGTRLAGMLAAVDALALVERTPVQAIHGDLHVGQVLRRPEGLAVIDFDGAPTLAVDQEPADMDGLAPVARDVAQMLCSLDHVALVVDRRTDGRLGDALRAWAAGAKADLLRGYRAAAATGGRATALDTRLLPAFVIEQECREILYAAAVLPRWRYAPVGALRWLLPEER
jgi:maltokinase